MNNLLSGAVAGTVATVPMTIFWEAMHDRMPGEPPRPLPPREVAEALVVKAGVSRRFSESEIEWLAMALHFGYGAFTGAIFGTMAPRHAGRGIVAGALFGVGVWTASYLGWLPAAGVRQSPRYDVPARTRLILASHVVWGAAAGLLLGARTPAR
jgi:uncharacterized membrane protein YagU involved in acid resistance